MLNRNCRRKPLNTVFDELHHGALAVDLLRPARAVTKRDRASRPLTAFAHRAFPHAAEVVFQTFSGALHGAELGMRSAE
jgi:hypothetical protein